MKLSSSCPKEWRKRKKKSRPAGYETARQPCQAALLGWWLCGTQHKLIPTGNEKPFKASEFLTRPSPCAGLSPSRAMGWHAAQGTGCLRH